MSRLVKIVILISISFNIYLLNHNEVRDIVFFDGFAEVYCESKETGDIFIWGSAYSKYSEKNQTYKDLITLHKSQNKFMNGEYISSDYNCRPLKKSRCRTSKWLQRLGCDSALKADVEIENALYRDI